MRSTPLFSPRSGIFAGFKGSRGQFHEKISASFSTNPTARIQLFFLSDVFLAWMCMARGGDTPKRKWSLEQRLVLTVECVEACSFPRALKAQNRPKMGVRTYFRHRGSILSRRAWRVAPVAA